MVFQSNFFKRLFFAISGGAYLVILSTLQINPVLKSYVVLLPLQMVALVYGVYLIRKNKQSDSWGNIDID